MARSNSPWKELMRWWKEDLDPCKHITAERRRREAESASEPIHGLAEKRMVSRWAFDQSSNTVQTLQWPCLTGWRFTMLCAHQRPYTGCAHRHFLHHSKQTHFRESNLRHLRLARVPVEMLTHYTNPTTPKGNICHFTPKSTWPFLHSRIIILRK